MTHYVCTGGCGGASDKTGVCQADGCAKHHQPLIECDCEDDKHNAAFQKTGVSTQSSEGLWASFKKIFGGK